MRAALLFVLAFASAALAAPARCPAGRGWNGNGCQDCQAGQYADGVVYDTCQSCDMNTFSGPKAASCTPCDAGKDTRFQRGASSCQSCDTGRFTPGNRQSCTECSPGTYAPTSGSTGCTKCSPGYFTRDRAASQCQTCQEGDYQPDEGTTECKICPRGYYTNKRAQTACMACACGTFNSVERQSSCQECPKDGSYSPPSPPASISSDQCIRQGQGAGFYYGPDNCPQQCPGGSYSASVRSGSCTTCPVNSVSPVGSTSVSYCFACPAGSRPNASKTACTQLPTGVPAPQRKRSRAGNGGPGAGAGPAFICPKGLEACPIRVGRGKALKTVYECIDIESNVESCGGCPSDVGGEGEDCTAFDQNADAQCVQGVCRYTCPKGWSLGARGCVKKGSAGSSGVGEAGTAQSPLRYGGRRLMSRGL